MDRPTPNPRATGPAALREEGRPVYLLYASSRAALGDYRDYLFLGRYTDARLAAWGLAMAHARRTIRDSESRGWWEPVTGLAYELWAREANADRPRQAAHLSDTTFRVAPAFAQALPAPLGDVLAAADTDFRLISARTPSPRPAPVVTTGGPAATERAQA